MVARWALLTAGVAACSGGGPGTRVDPEICDDGIDNDGDGAIDCDDDNCGGLICRDVGDDDDDTGTTLPPIDIVFDEPCCDFQYFQEDCPFKTIGRFTIVNRTEEDGEFDVSCDLVEEVAPIQWQVVGGGNRKPFVVNAPLYAGEQEQVDVYFVCNGVSGDFTTQCRAKGDAGEESLLVEFRATATRL